MAHPKKKEVFFTYSEKENHSASFETEFIFLGKKFHKLKSFEKSMIIIK